MGSEEDQEKNLLFLNIGQVPLFSFHSSCLLWFMTIIRYVIIDENTTPPRFFWARAVCSLSPRPPLASLFLPVVSHLWHVSPFSLSLVWLNFSSKVLHQRNVHTYIQRDIRNTTRERIHLLHSVTFICVWLYALSFRFIIVVCVQMNSVTLESLLRLSARKWKRLKKWFWFAHIVGEETCFLFIFNFYTSLPIRNM